MWCDEMMRRESEEDVVVGDEKWEGWWGGIYGEGWKGWCGGICGVGGKFKDRPRVFWGLCICARTWWEPTPLAILFYVGPPQGNMVPVSLYYIFNSPPTYQSAFNLLIHPNSIHFFLSSLKSSFHQAHTLLTQLTILFF